MLGAALARVRGLTDLRHWGAHARSRPSARIVRVLAALPTIPNRSGIGNQTGGPQMTVQRVGVIRGTWASRCPPRADLRAAALTYHTDRSP